MESVNLMTFSLFSLSLIHLCLSSYKLSYIVLEFINSSSLLSAGGSHICTPREYIIRYKSEKASPFQVSQNGCPPVTPDTMSGFLCAWNTGHPTHTPLSSNPWIYSAHQWYNIISPNQFPLFCSLATPCYLISCVFV